MKKIRTNLKCSLVVFGVFLWLLPLTGEGATINVNCATQSLQINGINVAGPGDTISVTGTCNENVSIGSGITIDGNNTAIINGPNNTQPTVWIYATPIVTIKNFHSIQGGQDGIRVYASPVVTIDNNIVQTTGRHGIKVDQNSSAIIINNQIKNNPKYGILIDDGSHAQIGFSTSSDITASPNTIMSNVGYGIVVDHFSYAQIVGNTISGNTSDGVLVADISYAQISDNTINSNGVNGVWVAANSVGILGSNTGATIFDLPNSTTVDNGGFGVDCSWGGYLYGRIGSLNGVNGPIGNDYGIKTSDLFDVADYGVDLVTGSDGRIRLANGVADNTTKAARMVVRHYSNSQLPVYLFGSASTATDNFVAFGGGSPLGNAATQLDLFTAPNTTTPVGTSRITIKGNGYVGIGTQTPSYPLQMAGGAYSDGGSWIDASSREYKDKIKGLKVEDAIETLQGLNPVTFSYKVSPEENHVGFIAEDVPDLLATKDRKGLSPMDIVAVLTKVVQDQQKTISTLREELNELKEKVR